MAYNGFTSYESGAKMWTVYWTHGTTHVFALDEMTARERFKAKYPDRQILKVVR